MATSGCFAADEHSAAPGRGGWVDGGGRSGSRWGRAVRTVFRPGSGSAAGSAAVWVVYLLWFLGARGCWAQFATGVWLSPGWLPMHVIGRAGQGARSARAAAPEASLTRLTGHVRIKGRPGKVPPHHPNQGLCCDKPKQVAVCLLPGVWWGGVVVKGSQAYLGRPEQCGFRRQDD